LYDAPHASIITRRTRITQGVVPTALPFAQSVRLANPAVKSAPWRDMAAIISHHDISRPLKKIDVTPNHSIVSTLIAREFLSSYEETFETDFRWS
jgi:hypothetical protein